MNKYIKKIKKYIKRNPEQSALLIYNTGVFSWLQANVHRINELQNIPGGPMTWMFSKHFEMIKGFITSLPYGWLIISFFLTFIMKKVKKTVRKIIIWGLILVGLYFMWGYAKTSGWF